MLGKRELNVETSFSNFIEENVGDSSFIYRFRSALLMRNSPVLDLAIGTRLMNEPRGSF